MIYFFFLPNSRALLPTFHTNCPNGSHFALMGSQFAQNTCDHHQPLFCQSRHKPLSGKCTYTKHPTTPPQNTPFPGLNLKVGKINWAKMFEKWAKLFEKGANFFFPMNSYATFHDLWTHIWIHLYEEFIYMKNIVKSYLKSCVPRFQMSATVPLCQPASVALAEAKKIMQNLLQAVWKFQNYTIKEKTSLVCVKF